MTIPALVLAWNIFSHPLLFNLPVPLPFGTIPWRREWQPTPVFLPGESQGWGSLDSYSPRGRRESGTAELADSGFHSSITAIDDSQPDYALVYAFQQCLLLNGCIQTVSAQCNYWYVTYSFTFYILSLLLSVFYLVVSSSLPPFVISEHFFSILFSFIFCVLTIALCIVLFDLSVLVVALRIIINILNLKIQRGCSTSSRGRHRPHQHTGPLTSPFCVVVLWSITSMHSETHC